MRSDRQFGLKSQVARVLRRGRVSEVGQAAVELAVCLPVMLALAVISVDLLVYLGDCARFDRVSAQEVAVVATAPAGGSYSPEGSAASVKAAIAEGMGQPERLSYQVSVSQGMRTGEKDEGFSLISLAPQLTTYTCIMESSPWPLSHGLFGVEVSGLTHRRSYVVDPYRPGIVA